MHHPCRVRVLERLGDGKQGGRGQIGRVERLLVAEDAQRATANELGDEVRFLRGEPAEVVDVEDVRVMEPRDGRSEEHTSELQSQSNLVCRLLLEKKKTRPIPPSRARPYAGDQCHRGAHGRPRGSGTGSPLATKARSTDTPSMRAYRRARTHRPPR